MTVQVCNLSTVDKRQKDPRGLLTSLAGMTVSKLSERPSHKKQGKVTGLHMCMCTCSYLGVRKDFIADIVVYNLRLSCWEAETEFKASLMTE